MKYINKGAAPRQLTEWFKMQPIVNGERINCRYEQLDPGVKDIIEQQLLSEQGWLCCYTGMTLTGDNFHIEHLIPRAESKRKGTHEDVSFKNMLVAYPKNSCVFGAQARGELPLPVTPLQRRCENKFIFNLQGKISGVDSDAKVTIRHLKLDHSQLDELRSAVIDEVLFPDNRPLSRAKVEVIAKQYCRKDTAGRYPRFCFVVTQAAQQLLGKIDRERKKHQAIRKRI
jgi:uncharacterized protein (TIGR02646 family)